MEQTHERGERVKIGFYTTGEEIFNAVTHGVGALLAVAALVLSVVFAAIFGDGLSLLAALLYGLSLLVMYSMSTLYHAITHKGAKRVLRVFDHCAIFLLIAGTYSPYTLITLRGSVGYTLFGAIWGVALIGITLKAVSMRRFEKIGVVLNVLMGWAAMFTIRPLYRALHPAGFWLLIAGGVVYTLGIVFYASKWKFAHSVWHLFVLSGSVLHFLSIILFVIT
jgi:hemolysin III